MSGVRCAGCNQTVGANELWVEALDKNWHPHCFVCEVSDCTSLHTRVLYVLYMCTCIHAYMHTCVHAYMRTCIHAYMHTCVYCSLFVVLYLHHNFNNLPRSRASPAVFCTYVRMYIHAYECTQFTICVCTSQRK